MTIRSMPIRSFDLRTASADDYAALNAFENRIRAERLPDDPPIPLAEAVHGWQHIPDFVEVSQWVIWHPEGTGIIAGGDASVLRLDTNQHMIDFGIAVLPEFRRQGLARSLLVPLVELAQRENRRLLISATNERVPAGEAFMARMGARQGLVAHTNQLVLAELDRGLLQRWQAQGAERASSFRLGLWAGAYPEEYLDAIVQLHEVMNTEPRDQLEIEDFHMTAEHLRQIEQSFTARGTERWTMYVAEQATGQMAGYTEVFWNANRPYLLYQGDTAVFPNYRNRGLGRLLKAAMMQKVLLERPQVQFVRTGNADSNAAMLKINREMGFKPYLAECVWQVETQQVADYLGV
jgi:GNAT superfamily N-acetyltransferase